MSSAAPALHRPDVLADTLPRSINNSVVLVGSAVLWISVLAQVKIPLGFTPVPITLGTFAVATVGGALGSRRGVIATALYLALGLVGVPVFQGGEAGWTYATGATGGYLVGYLILAWWVGAAADRQADRRFLTFFGAIVAANATLYLLGASWLAYRQNIPLLIGDPSGFTLGVRPFIIPDLIKMIAAGALFPTAWRIIKHQH